MEGGEDPHLAILTYATTPLNHSLPSPAELLNSRKFRCILPVRITQQNQTHRYRNIMQQQKRQQTHYYNRNARDLHSLKTAQPVYAQLVPRTRNWVQGHIIERLSQRTYKIKTYNGGTYIRNSIVAGLSSTKAYQQCISKGSNLTLNECIRICQTEDATRRQVQALRPESTDCSDSTPLHHINEFPQACPKTNFRGRGGYNSNPTKFYIQVQVQIIQDG